MCPSNLHLPYFDLRCFYFWSVCLFSCCVFCVFCCFEFYCFYYCFSFWYLLLSSCIDSLNKKKKIIFSVKQQTEPAVWSTLQQNTHLRIVNVRGRRFELLIKHHWSTLVSSGKTVVLFEIGKKICQNSLNLESSIQQLSMRFNSYHPSHRHRLEQSCGCRSFCVLLNTFPLQTCEV